jgi:hypothetical protein
VLRRRQQWYTRPERQIAGTLADYLLFKAKNLPTHDPTNQGELPFST